MMENFCGDAIDEAAAREMNPLVLAFVGDSVQTLYIRAKLALSHDFKSGKLHELASRSVCAGAQAKTYEEIKHLLSDEEMDIYRRARNSKNYSGPKNASVADYRKATGFEAVLGYLYLTGKHDRLFELLKHSCREI
ncbi:MAG: ribonuclease III [Clostridiales bacterium]|jgi:ribonuclease-3 family protein|nr:ribonuclease III [Clostridiales bacterium]